MKDAPREFAKVISCDYCSRQGFPKLLRDDTFNLPQPGYIGSNYKNTGVLLVGQNPGVSPDRFSVQDRKFADAQIAVRDSANAASYGGMKNVLDGIMPTWPVVTKHFPLAECGLQLDDIAYVNVVRCRTHNNGTPGTKIIQACVSNHFVRWLDWLQPRVVVCIGKWAHGEVLGLLEDGIPNGFINRRRSLSGTERRENKESVVSLVRRIRKHGKAARPSPHRSADAACVPVSSPSRESSTMDAEGYIKILAELGFDRKERPNDGQTLKHRRHPVPSLYFNRNRGGLVYFVGYLDDWHLFPSRFWNRLPAQKPTDDKPNLITIVPQAGREREAFKELPA